METQPKLKSSASTYKAAIRTFDGPVIRWKNHNNFNCLLISYTLYKSLSARYAYPSIGIALITTIDMGRKRKELNKPLATIFL